MAPPTVHVIGAGLAGLAAGLELAAAGHRVVLHEAASHAGGRCRSYMDRALGCRIDNGNHLVLSANRDVQWMLETCGASDSMLRPERPEFPFVDLASGERWTLRPSIGRLPLWIFDERRRVPGTRALDYLAPLKLRRVGPAGTVEQAFDTRSAAWKKLWRPFAIAALNTETDQASARLLWNVIAESFGRGGQALFPLVPREGLSESFIDPALRRLASLGAELRYGRRLRALRAGEQRILALEFTDGTETLAENDRVVLAVPGQVAPTLGLPIDAPRSYRPIVNAHFRFSHRNEGAAILGVIGGLTEWIFAKPGVLSVTISAADHVVDEDAERLAPRIWAEVCKAVGLASLPLPPWRIVKEKRATFAATPEEDARRPGPRTRWRNLTLAGDWTQNGLPSTIEGAIRTGRRAAADLAGPV